MTYSCQGLVKDWIERRVQVFLYILQQNRIPKLNGSLQHPQEVWHLKVDDFQALRISTHDHRSEKNIFILLYIKPSIRLKTVDWSHSM